MNSNFEKTEENYFQKLNSHQFAIGVNHQCIEFRSCGKCYKKYCNVCRACKCAGECDTCGDYTSLIKCSNCAQFVCHLCTYYEGFIGRKINRIICFDCFKQIRSICGQLKCKCQRCSICQNLTNLICHCGKVAICHECSLISNKCSECYNFVWFYCPLIGDINFKNHRCRECYNIFIDPNPEIKKRMATALMCLSAQRRIPKPIRLMICSMAVEYQL